MPNISACYLANRVMFSKWSIHFLSCFLIQGHERMEPVPAVTVERQGTPWTGLQCTAGRTQRRRQSFMLMFSPTANLDSPINLISMFLDYTVFGVYPERISYKWFQTKIKWIKCTCSNLMIWTDWKMIACCVISYFPKQCNLNPKVPVISLFPQIYINVLKIWSSQGVLIGRWWWHIHKLIF